MDLTTPIQYVKGVGPRRAELFAQLGVDTAGALLLHVPRDYLDRSRLVPIGQVQPGQTVTIIGRVRSVHTVRTRRGMRNVVARVADASGEIGCVWFNQPFRERQLAANGVMLFSGTVGVFRGVQMTNPEFEPLEEDEQERLHTGRIVPVYPLTEGLTQRIVRTSVRDVLDAIGTQLPDPLPEAIRTRRALLPRAEALRTIHFPATFAERDRARERLAFDELLALQLVLGRRRRAQAGDAGIAFTTDGPLLARFRAALPFRLTGAQERTLGEILADMREPRVMHRLLQGDVGSGKTVVAVGACVAACDSGFQAAIMAPTEILAEQHHATIVRLLGDLPVRAALLTGRLRVAARREILYGVASGGIGIVCGTHALIQEEVRFARLGLLVIDEQQRFGVRHRLALREKAGDAAPDVLVTTATPIPRTLAMSFYGDLDVSTLDDLPPGRGEVTTHLAGPEKRDGAFEFIARTAREGRQVYIVYPAIDESDTLAVRAATRMAEALRDDPRFAGVSVGLVHGRQKPPERDEVMSGFRDGAVQVLVATTVIEVGVDVPNATVMVVEHPERYGLSQLHQLRGRVGRGAHRSYFVLLADDSLQPEARERLEVLVRTRDGFRVAEEDLRRRGPGELLGTRQHGVPQLRAADLLRDGALVAAAREDADALLADDPELVTHAALRASLETWFGDADKLLTSG